MNKKLAKIIKPLVAVVMSSAFALTFAACGENGHTHVDNNGDRYCDDCHANLGSGQIDGGGETEKTEISLDMKAVTLNLGGTQQLTATVTPEGKPITWSSDTPAVATVSDTGLVTAIAAGTANVTATADGKSVTCKVTVNDSTEQKIEVSSVTVTPTDLTLKKGQSQTIIAEVAPANATNRAVTWSSDAKDIATVDDEGKVTAVAKGTAHIIAVADGKSATCTVTVTEETTTKPTEPTEPAKPVIPESGPEITKFSGDLEAGFVCWKAAKNATWYNVYIRPAGGSYTKLDDQLVRQYPDYYRADAVGLKAGEYEFKVTPVGTDGEVDNLSSTVRITVKAHTREGFAFVNGTSSGAYNDDGTLKANAKVLYVTEKTKNTVSMTVTGADTTPCVGLQTILDGYAKGKETTPLDIRLIGNITDPDYTEKGDILIDTKLKSVGITVEGIGDDATANGWGVRLKNASNVEIRNIGFMNCHSNEGDNLGLQQGNNHVWTHNNDMFYGGAGSDADQVKGDGALDTKKSTNITHSYNHFWDSGKCNLQGMKSETTDNTITYHHNWYDHSDSRHPRIRTCTVHVYNNYFDGVAKYGVGVTMGASAFVENNYFRSTANMNPMLSSNQGTDALGEGTFSGENGGIIKAFGNVFDGKYALITQNDTTDKTNIDCYVASSKSEKVPADYKTKAGGTTYNNFDTAADMYDYTVDTPEEAKDNVMKYAGRMNGGDFKWTFDNAKEDGNYAVIPELKSALTSYKTTLVKVGGEDSASQPSTPDNPNPDNPNPNPDNPNPDNPDTPIVAEGQITYYPSRDGYAGVTGVQISGISGAYTSNKAATEVTINGVTIGAKKALKMDSKPTITITPSENMTLTLYLMVNNIKLNDEKISGTSESGYYIITATLEKGKTYTIKKGDGENALYALLLTPVTTA